MATQNLERVTFLGYFGESLPVLTPVLTYTIEGDIAIFREANLSVIPLHVVEPSSRR